MGAMRIKDEVDTARLHSAPRGASSIRKMRRTDIGQIARIEAATFLGPWPASYFRDCQAAGHECYVLDNGGTIEGYAVMAVARRVAHLLNLCVRPTLRGRGLGRRLLSHMVAVGRAAATGMVLEVRVSNQSAIHLYRSVGFFEVGLRRQYYPTPEGREDALVMMKNLGSAEGG